MGQPYNVKSRVLASIAYMLVPLVRILLRNGISFREFSDAAKRTFVEACESDRGEANSVLTDARIAIVTGLTRSEVNTIRRASAPEVAHRLVADSISRVLQGWHEDKDFLGPYGMPRDLTLDDGNSAVPGIKELTGRYAAGVRTHVLVNAMLTAGVAEVIEDGCALRVKQRAYIERGSNADVVEAIARSARRFLDTAEANTRATSTDEKIFDRFVIKDALLRTEDWNNFKKLVEERMQPALEDLDSRFSHFDAPGRDEGGLSVGVGIYIFRDERAGDV